jgi:hypothetical protein
MQIVFLVFDALTEEFHTNFRSKNFYFLHFLIFLQLWWQFPDVEKLGLGFPRTFLRFDANRVLKNDRLNRGNPYVFFFKKLLLFTFFSVFAIAVARNFQMWKNWALFFPNFFCVSCKSGFQN